MRVIMGCILCFFIVTSVAFAESVKEKIANYQTLVRALNNDNIIWLPGLGSGPARYMHKQTLTDNLMQELIEKGTYTPAKHAELIFLAVEASKATKMKVKGYLLPELRSEIESLTTYPNNSLTIEDDGSSSGNSSFADFLNEATSDEHLGTLSYDNHINGESYSEPSYSQCPDWRPENLSGNRLDSNNNPSDSTYVECNYFNNGRLSHQTPYVNGKKEGTVLKFTGSPVYALVNSVSYSNDKKNGTEEMWRVNSKSGHVSRLRKSEFTNGKLHGERITYHENTVISVSAMYNDGRVTSSCHYDKSGKQTYCTEY